MTTLRPATRKLLLGCIIAAACGLLAWQQDWLPSDGRDATHGPGSPPAETKTQRSEDLNESHRELAKLPPHLQKIARQLKAAADDELRNYLATQNSHLSQKLWTAFARRQIEILDTTDIAALAAALKENPALDEMIGHAFRPALHFVWGARDHTAARAHLMRVAEASGYRRDQEDTWMMTGDNRDVDSHINLTRGHASVDPAGAWRIFQQEMHDPATSRFGDARTNLTSIIQAYAAIDPEEARKILLSGTNPGDLEAALRGFTAAAPAGQDWESLAAAYAEALRAWDEKPTLSDQLHIAEPWLLEDPAAAFKWLCAHGDIEELRKHVMLATILQVDMTAPLPGLEETSADTDFKLALLDHLYSSDQYRVPEAVEVLRNLATHGQPDLVARFIQREIGGVMGPEHLELLPLLPTIDPPALRHALFLDTARAVRPLGEDEVIIFDWNQPNLSLDAIRASNGTLDLPASVRTEVAAILAEVERKQAERKQEEAKISRGQ